jgi:hypothetical protein
MRDTLVPSDPGDGAEFRKYQIVQTEGARTVERAVEGYNLDVIISVGYRVRSHRGTQFRRWATRRLRDYLLQGFVLDEERLKQGRQRGAFEELQARIRAIRVSERPFTQKLTDLYATSVDYDPDHPQARAFVATVQNKLHGAIRGRTAAERIAERADAAQPQRDLTAGSAPGGRLRKVDAEVAGNDLTAEERWQLERLVEQYLSFAELRAELGKEIRMADWEAPLDALLRLNGYPVLEPAGQVSEPNAARERAKPAARRRGD